VITDAERDEIREQAVNYIRKLREEYEEAKLGDRIDAKSETDTETFESQPGPAFADDAGIVRSEGSKITG